MTAASLRTAATEVLQRIAAAERVFCFLDYDGTLAPLAPTHDEARPLPGTASLLEQLATAPETLVAIVTGRTVADLRRFLDVQSIYYVGIHGLETRLPNGVVVEVAEGVELARSVLPAIKQQVQQALSMQPGILFEDKGPALACHYRLASPDSAAIARRLIANAVQTYQQRGVQIGVMQGHEVIEIRPTTTNKGTAASVLLNAHGPEALAVYVGDDQTDEDAFAVLPAESITVRVGPATAPTAARYHVAGPGDVHEFLGAIRDCRYKRAEPGGHRLHEP